MHLDLNPRGVQVVGVYMGYMDTDMTAGVDAPKTSPWDVVRQVLDGIEAGAAEILADQLAAMFAPPSTDPSTSVTPISRPPAD
jgi:NAD(P)-dependent dehydrogenase (short-subunit alcohol dehydrogenase family)